MSILLKKVNPRILIITDLDGTLLHHRTYSFETAMPALKLVEEKKIPLILCSSKTRREIEVYRIRLKNEHPFISENGGGIFIPQGYFKSPIEGKLINGYISIILGKTYHEIRSIFLDIRNRLNIKAKGFGDMTPEEIASLTGLALEEAEIARERDFDEPIIFENKADIEKFLPAIQDVGLSWTQGRFYHIHGENDKGKALKILKGFYEECYDEVKTIGLGNNLNDLPFLKEVDCPILVQNEGGIYDKQVEIPNLIKADGIGPEGWNRMVLRLIAVISQKFP